MVKPLSEQLSELSVRAKSAKDHVAAAEQEARDKVMARREESRAAVAAAINKVDQDIQSAGDAAADKWSSLKAKISSDMDSLKTNIVQRKHDLDVKRADTRADALEWEASVAIEYAVASIQQAELAVYDAIIGRAEAGQARTA
jgi:ElaB/YqjD/DUF883 family membrane-anchored ribosome-binding protein